MALNHWSEVVKHIQLFAVFEEISGQSVYSKLNLAIVIKGEGCYGAGLVPGTMNVVIRKYYQIIVC